MPLLVHQRAELQAAIQSYGFAPRYFDFLNAVAVSMPDMRTVERVILDMLSSSNTRDIRCGLANVLVWGDAELSDRVPKVVRFLSEVTRTQLGQFKDAVAAQGVPSLIQLKDLKIPGFSTLPWLSKIAAFLNPKHYCVLDRSAVKLGVGEGSRALHRLASAPNLSLTPAGEAAYDGWRQECRSISTVYFGNGYRAVDVERGLCQLIRSGRLAMAQGIYADA